MTTEHAVPRNAWETCPTCRGSGLGLNMAGEPDHCWECKGDTVIRARDEKGRFVANPMELQP